VASAAVAIGQYLTAITTDFHLNTYAMAVAFFVCGFGNIVNDIRDIESDRINHPRRALPSGLISIEQARTLAFMFLSVSVLLLIMLNGISRLIVILALILVTIYNLKLKHTVYWGNLLVSLLGSFTFLIGGATYGLSAMLSIPGPVVPAVFAFLMHFGREIAKDIEDRTGDALTGSKTAPIHIGTGQSLVLIIVVFAMLIAVSLLAYLKGWFNNSYLYIVVLGVYVPLILHIIWLASGLEQRKLRVFSITIKLSMIAGLLALILGRNY
jgi:geranylgeranylglycerol-phosphate geranylgeranyltransferase